MNEIRAGTTSIGTGELRHRVHELMPKLTAELAELVAVPSIPEVGYPEPAPTPGGST